MTKGRGRRELWVKKRETWHWTDYSFIKEFWLTSPWRHYIGQSSSKSPSSQTPQGVIKSSKHLFVLMNGEALWRCHKNECKHKRYCFSLVTSPQATLDDAKMYKRCMLSSMTVFHAGWRLSMHFKSEKIMRWQHAWQWLLLSRNTK